MLNFLFILGFKINVYDFSESISFFVELQLIRIWSFALKLEGRFDLVLRCLLASLFGAFDAQ